MANALMALIEENYDAALENAEKCLLQNPDDLQARLVQGQALNGLAKSADAIAVFMRILAETPDSVDAMFHLGNIFLGLGELEKALGYFERIKKFSPEHSLIDENINSIKAKLSQIQPDE
jgi:tetratricopeptide (TPR) repeat protein